MSTEIMPTYAVSERAERTRRELQIAIDQYGNPQFTKRWLEWDGRLDQIVADCGSRPEVAISLVGGTGSGKSTLLNALIGARLLPVSSMRACTAAISEVSYATGPHYSADIEFISRASWQSELDMLRADIVDASGPLDDEADQDDGALAVLSITRAARDKLGAVYGLHEDADFLSFDPSLPGAEPAEITAALDLGVAHLESEDIASFSKAIDKYLNSKEHYWPIVKTVHVCGPFDCLRGGVKLVDLPGINDPNEAREEVTRNYLKTCRYVWIVFNIKRVLTKDTTNIMQSDDFVRQVVMDGRSNSLTFVGTASDDIDTDDGRQEFGLADDASDPDVIKARNTAARSEIANQLDELSGRLAKMAGANRTQAEALASTFKSSRIYTVSAREYQRLKGLSKTRSAGLETAEETELPQLIAHMKAICESYGVDAHAASLHREISAVVDEIERERKAFSVQLQRRNEESAAQAEEVERALETGRSFLGNELRHARELFDKELEVRSESLRERLRRGVETAKRDVTAITDNWSRMHWCTLRAVVRRHGQFVGSTGRFDFSADLSKPILNTVAFTWAEFFGPQLTHILEGGQLNLRQISGNYSLDLKKAVLTASEAVVIDVEAIGMATETGLSERLSQFKTRLESKIQEVQRRLYESVPQQVDANMRAAFELAAKESGAGMKYRMTVILQKHALAVSSVMYSDAELAVNQGVRELLDMLSREYGEMADLVQRYVEVLGDPGDQLSPAAQAQALENLDQLGAVVKLLSC